MTTATEQLWGIDLGGTKIEAAIVDAARPDRALFRARVATESHLGYDRVIGQIRAAVEQLERASKLRRPERIGIGTPGTMDPSTNLLKNSNSTCLNGRPVHADLTRALATDVRIANDANCFALAEATFGAASRPKRDVVIGLILGTGVGSGIVVHGRVLDGLHGIAGEWGHNPLRGENEPCYCGRTGCVETVISGPALERFYHQRTGSAAQLAHIVASVDRDADARATVERLQCKFGEAIAAVINILDPDAIVIGGGVGNIAQLYDDRTRAAIRQHLFNPELRTDLLRPALGDSAGVFGAALLTLQ